MELLIIEDHLTIVFLVKEFLQMLGYENVRHAVKGSEGVEVFREMVESGNEPVVLLDYDLGDTTGLDVLRQLLEIKPTAKVIMATAHSRDDVAIQECIASGAYDYLEKPIRLEKLKQILQVLIIESGVDDKKEKIQDVVDNIISRSNQLSLEKIVEETHFQSEDILEYLKKLEADKIIKSIGDVKQVSCNSCESVNVSQTFFCPNCHNSDFKQGSLIEHYDCGYVALSEEFKDYVCPQCQKRLKARGVDHKVTENYYVCQECGDKFPEPRSNYICQKCNNKFSIEDAKWTTSPGYQVIKQNYSN